MPIEDGLSADTAERLKDLLHDCTANIRHDGASRGSAFFVSHDLLLTCEHVVHGLAEVEVVPYRRQGRTGVVVQPNPGAVADLALIRVQHLPGEAPQPAPLLTRTLKEGEFYLVGYPRETGAGTGQEGFTTTGHPRRPNTTDELPPGHPDTELLQLEAGKLVTYGLSGGPVMSLRTGSVVAVTRTSRDATTAQGGSAIPLSAAVTCFPDDVGALLSDPPVTVRRWRNELGRDRWQLLGQTWNIAATIDLSVKGDIHQWKICSEVVPDGELLSASDLGDDVTEAMFSWAQRRRLTGQPEVNLVGRLLARALFPQSAQSHFSRLAEADDVTVRLHLDPDGYIGHIPLVDIPWELAGIPGKEGFLAADPRYRLVRVDDSAPDADPWVPSTAAIRVLGVVALPTAYQYPVWHGVESKWPGEDGIAKQLAEHCGGESFQLDMLVNPHNDVLHDHLRDRPYDVLHFIGVGRANPSDGRAQHAMTVNRDGDASWADTGQVIGWAQSAGVKVVVLQLTGPPLGHRLNPIAPRSLGGVVRGSVQAAVYTRFPAHHLQIDRFNDGFYRYLGRGATLPAAVQDGRRRVADTPIGEDAAGFGCFSLLTGAFADLRLIRELVDTPGRRSVQQTDVTPTWQVSRAATEDATRSDTLVWGR